MIEVEPFVRGVLVTAAGFNIELVREIAKRSGFGTDWTDVDTALVSTCVTTEAATVAVSEREAEDPSGL